MLTFTDKPMEKKYQQNLDKGRFKFSPAYKSLHNGQDDEGEGRNHTWDDNRAGVSRSQISKETGGPVQLLWANMWRHETAKAKTANSLQPEGQDTQQIYCTEILQRDFSTILFRSEEKQVNFFWEMLTQVFRKKQTTASNSGNGRDNHRHVLLHFN